MTESIIRVALFTPIRRLFDYLSVETSPLHLQAGMRVKVPFGKTERIAMIMAIAEHSDYEKHKLKRIAEVLDEAPLFSSALLKLFQWASQYYHCSLGEVIEAALPSWFRKGKVPPSIDNLKLDDVKLDHPKRRKDFIKDSEINLNETQNSAVNAILASLKSYKAFLLEGVTGSGKTEVYMQLIEKCLADQLQALVLVPEIGLTPQMLARFEKRFSVPIAVLHSSISEKKRARAWVMAKEGLAPIVIGTRSSAFVPLKAPGIFIIDEEHDASFKQQDGFRYSARDLLVMRAHLEQCPIVLGSATPSLESLQNARTGRYNRLVLPLRAGKAILPEIQILDIRHKKLDEGLSAQLIACMKQHLKEKGQVLLFLNRRGFAPALMCFDCGFIAECKHCDARLTLHFQSQQLRCHHCEFSSPIITRCPKCQARNLQPLGVGTERLEAALKRYFPAETIVRIDRDSTRRKGKLAEALAQIHDDKAQILLGTQMIAKGHHFPNVTLVGILDIDQALFSNDFRSPERLGQLITQVAGRSGRSDRFGQVILQSCHPEHPLLKLLLNQGYALFAENLLLERRKTTLPPFSYQALIRSETKVHKSALNFLANLKMTAQKIMADNNLALQILGPIAAPMEKKDGKYRAQLLLQAEKRPTLQSLMAAILNYVEKNPPKSTIRWSLDVDPIDMY